MSANIIITGGSFNNKGAQTMLMITLSELRLRYPNIELYYSSNDKNLRNESKVFKFKYLFKYSLIDALAKECGELSLKKSIITFLRRIYKKNLDQSSSVKYTQKVLKETKCVIDISGYNLASKFSIQHNMNYLNMIKHFHKLEIPIILLPQSFGPFEYKENYDRMMSYISEVMRFPEIIFAREPGGYELLTKQLGLTNVVLSDDLVLQNKEIHWDLIMKDTWLDKKSPEISTKRNVAIVPNKKIMEHSKDTQAVYDIYFSMIENLINKDRNIYLIWHSNEDRIICRNIAEKYKTYKNVHFLDCELSFYQYEDIITSFDYIIASRFHSIVHAFRHGVPCIGLGWAEKYENLFARCGQEAYIFNISQKNVSESLLESIDVMDGKYKSESQKIQNRVAEICKENCFSLTFNKMDSFMKKKED